MSVFERLLNSIKLNDDDDIDDNEYLDEYDDEMDDTRPSKRFLSRRDEEDVGSTGADPRLTSERSRRGNRDVTPSSRITRRARNSYKVSAFHPRKTAGEEQTNNFSVCVIKPKSMEDSLQIAQTLLADCTIILNLEGIDLDVSQRIFDFSSGACCAVRGRLDKISNYIFVLTPADVKISGEFQEILTGAFDPDLDLDDSL